MSRQSTQAVSPVVSVILMVAVTVILSAVIGAFVFNLGQSVDGGNTQNIGLSSGIDGPNVTFTVVTGTADSIELWVNGTVSDSKRNVSPGTTLSAAATSESDITVVSTTDGESQVLTTKNPIPTNSNSSAPFTPIVVDDFENNSFSNYTGDLTSFSRQTSVPSPDSSTTLIGTANNVGIISSSGLPAYPEQGNTFEYWFRIGYQYNGGQVYFGYQDSNNWYNIRMEDYTGVFVIREKSSGTLYDVASTSFNWQTDTWYRIEVVWGKSTITARIYDTSGTILSEISGGPQASHSTGGIQFATFASNSAASGFQIYWDDLTITG